MIKFYLKIQAGRQGFSLVETLVAISLLLIVISGPMAITARSAKSTTFATEQVQASLLAQEGLEMAQKRRDDLLLQQFANNSPGSAWIAFTTDAQFTNCYNSSGCGLEWSDNTNLVSPINCNTGTGCRLYYKPSPSTARSRFTHTATNNEITPFTRRIYFDTPTTNPASVRIRSVVTWRTGSLVSTQTVEAQTYLFNIYP